MKSKRTPARHPASHWAGSWLGLLAMVALLVACGGGGGGGSAGTGGSGGGGTPPAVSTAPLSVAVNDGASASFSVVATGSDPISYQWLKNGAAVPGATSASFSTGAVTLADDQAKYSVTVANAQGSVTSPAAVLTVRAAAAAIVTQPLSASVDDGASVTFSVVASGSAPISYQWQRNGVAVPGATAPQFTTNELTLQDDQAKYTVLVGNALGTQVSAAATVSVKAALPRLTSTPQSLTVKDGTPVTLSATAVGTGPLNFQWYRGILPILGANAPSYNFTSQLADDGVQFSVTVTNTLGTATSAPASLKVDANAAQFQLQPVNTTVATGASLVLTANASGSQPITYQWQRSDDGGFTWVDVPNAQTNRLNLGAATLASANASFKLLASNVAGTVASQAALVKVTPTVRIVAGTAGGPGFADGLGSRARFNWNNAVVVDAQGNAIVADATNRALRKVSPAGVVTTWLGSEAGWYSPAALAQDGVGNVYVGDLYRIFKVSPAGAVELWAGQQTYVAGLVDGPGTAATFGAIQSISADAAGNLVVADSFYNAIRLVSTKRVVSTLAGGQQQSSVQVDGQGAAARFTFPISVVRDTAGNIFVADGTAIRKVTASGQVSVYACSLNGPVYYQALQDGPRLSATCNVPRGLALDPAGNLYFGDLYTVRRISPDGMLSTVAGGNPQTAYADGNGSAAGVGLPNGMAWWPAANAMVFMETSAGAVRTVSGGGQVRSVAGLVPSGGLVNGQGSSARFSTPGQLVVAPSGVSYVIDAGNQLVRRIAADGRVSTFGSGVTLTEPNGLALDAAGNLLVSDRARHAIIRITPEGSMSVFAGKLDEPGSANGPAMAARFNLPAGLAMDGAGQLWVADSGNHTVRRISTGGEVSTVAGAAGQCGTADGPAGVGRLCSPASVAADRSGGAWVADGTGMIRRISQDGSMSVFAGLFGSTGHSDGPVARFAPPLALAVDALGNLFVADGGNSLIRKVTPGGYTSTVVGQRGVAALLPGAGGPINAPRGIAVTPAGRLLFTSEQAVVSD